MRKTLLLAALVLLVSSSAQARHHRRSYAAAAGEFDYYLLSLSWSPAFCLGKPDSPECSGPRRYGFIVHGLWPQNERGWPQNCADDAALPDSVVQGMADIMPAEKLIRHEWSTHGTCSGLAPADYFGLVRRAFESVTIPKDLTSPTNPIERPPGAVTDEFSRANPRLPAQSVVVTCSRQGAPRLREVHVCFTRDLGPRACSADALHEACRAPSVIIPPVR